MCNRRARYRCGRESDTLCRVVLSFTVVATVLPGLRTYPIDRRRREALIRFMIDALETAGCRILSAPRPDRAPFVLTFEAPDGERQGIVAYAFTATRTPTRNRPDDERSFQIKYGSKESYFADNQHELWQDPSGLYTTLLIGIDPIDGYFVSADPALHNPTKFFIRLEFKDSHAEAIARDGWHAWEREKRRMADAPPVEVLVGGRKERFLDLVRFERAAKGLAPGHRQLLAEKRHMFVSPVLSAPSAAVPRREDERILHALEAELSLSAAEILELIDGARRLKMAVRGWAAEEHLFRLLGAIPELSECVRLDEEGSADIRVRYRDGDPILIECKNVLRVRTANGLPRLDFQRTRASKSDPCSRYYAPEDFHVVAACLHAVTEEWDFRFMPTHLLPPHKKCPGRVASGVVISPDWRHDLLDVLGSFGGS